MRFLEQKTPSVHLLNRDVLLLIVMLHHSLLEFYQTIGFYLDESLHYIAMQWCCIKNLSLRSTCKKRAKSTTCNYCPITLSSNLFCVPEAKWAHVEFRQAFWQSSMMTSSPWPLLMTEDTQKPFQFSGESTTTPTTTSLPTGLQSTVTKLSALGRAPVPTTAVSFSTTPPVAGGNNPNTCWKQVT